MLIHTSMYMYMHARRNAYNIRGEISKNGIKVIQIIGYIKHIFHLKVYRAHLFTGLAK